MRPVRSLTSVAFFVFLALIAAGCSGEKSASPDVGKKEEKKGEARESPPRDELGSDWGDDRGSRKGDAKKGDDGSGGRRPEAREAKREEAHVGGVSPVAGAGKGPKSGTLTAGSFDDNLDRAPYRSFFKQFGQESAVRDLPGRFLGHRLVLTIRDG